MTASGCDDSAAGVAGCIPCALVGVVLPVVLRKVVEEQGIAGSCARARVSRHLVACRGCRADYDELVPVQAWLGRLAPAATLTSRSAGAIPAVRDWSDQ
jgi:hypothetical protein